METERWAERQLHQREGKDGQKRSRQMAEKLTRDYWEKGMSSDV